MGEANQDNCSRHTCQHHHFHKQQYRTLRLGICLHMILHHLCLFLCGSLLLTVSLSSANIIIDLKSNSWDRSYNTHTSWFLTVRAFAADWLPNVVGDQITRGGISYKLRISNKSQYNIQIGTLKNSRRRTRTEAFAFWSSGGGVVKPAFSWGGGGKFNNWQKHKVLLNQSPHSLWQPQDSRPFES